MLAHLGRAGGAVEPDDVGAHGVEGRQGGADLGAQQHAAGRLDGDLDLDRDLPAGVGHGPPAADDGRLGLEQVLDGLDDEAGRRRPRAARPPPPGSRRACSTKVIWPSEAILVPGPSEPATQRGRSAVGRAGDVPGDAGRRARPARGSGRPGRTRPAPREARRSCRSRPRRRRRRGTTGGGRRSRRARVTTSISLQPSRAGPPKSSAPRCRSCRLVPMAPSKITTRSRDRVEIGTHRHRLPGEKGPPGRFPTGTVGSRAHRQGGHQVPRQPGRAGAGQPLGRAAKPHRRGRADNGIGKSTLLRILAGLEHARRRRGRAPAGLAPRRLPHPGARRPPRRDAAGLPGPAHRRGRGRGGPGPADRRPWPTTRPRSTPTARPSTASSPSAATTSTPGSGPRCADLGLPGDRLDVPVADLSGGQARPGRAGRHRCWPASTCSSSTSQPTTSTSPASTGWKASSPASRVPSWSSPRPGLPRPRRRVVREVDASAVAETVSAVARESARAPDARGRRIGDAVGASGRRTCRSGSRRSSCRRTCRCKCWVCRTDTQETTLEPAHTGVPPLHRAPQPPQLLSLVNSTHAPLQALNPTSHANVHAPALHAAAALATFVVHA